MLLLLGELTDRLGGVPTAFLLRRRKDPSARLRERGDLSSSVALLVNRLVGLLLALLLQAYRSDAVEEAEAEEDCMLRL